MADIVRRDGWDSGLPTHAFPAFGGMRQMMDRLFDDSGFPGFTNGTWDEGMLPVDISEADGKLLVKASVPGFDKDDIDVQVHQGVLSINAKHSSEHETTGEKWYRRERRYGSVSRRIALPGIVHDAPVDAELKDGVLTLAIAVPEAAKPKQIEIKAS